jgi:hypothetical protein
VTLCDQITQVLVQNDFTLPKDSDADGLPDSWENPHGDLNKDGDIDTNVGNGYTGDGLTNFEEYRGFMWGEKMLLTSDIRYKTTVYLTGSVKHIRTHPKRKNLFVKYTGYDPINPFALGVAFNNAEIDVYAVDASTAAALGEQNIDVVLVTNDWVYTYPFTDGYINKRGLRDWTWDTKGSSGLGTATAYGTGTYTYQISLDHYFNDKPYRNNANTWLDPISAVEDKNDNGVDDRSKGVWESGSNGILDPDVYKIASYSEALTTFDIDKDNLVELPVATDPANINILYEYAKVQVLKHTITHEMGHAMGMDHNADSTCVMYEYSNNWSRDDHLSDTAKAQIQIHND